MNRIRWLIMIGLALAGAGIGSRAGFAARQPDPAPAPGSSPVENLSAAYEFGRSITFSGRLAPGLEVQSAALFFKPQNDPTTVVGDAAIDPAGGVSYVHDAAQRFVPAFSQVEYWFRLTLTGGAVLESERAWFFYEDNRFEWQELAQPPFAVHWYTGSAAFAQYVLDTAARGAAQMQTVTPGPLPDQLDIYIYANVVDYQFARGLLGRTWAAGHADPASGLVLLTLPPDPESRLEVERKVPHEVGHMMLYQALGAGFWKLPVWLNEGLASLNEFSPHPDDALLLRAAYQQGALLSFSQLCETFPQDAGGALLAYAQSKALAGYLRAVYGDEGLRAVTLAYANGAACDAGTLVRPVDARLSQVERDWRADQFGEKAWLKAALTLAPWLALTAAIFGGPVLLLAAARRKP